MSEQKAIQAIEPMPPFYYEAREYADRFGIDTLEELEKIRLSMCVREFNNRAKPWTDSLVRMSGYGLGIPPELEAQHRKIIEQIAKDLGLDLSPPVTRSTD